MTPTSYDSTTEPDPTDTGDYGSAETDLPDGPFKDWPGAGPVPDPEEEGFRQKILDIIEARRKRDRDEYEQRCEEAKNFYAGTGEPEPTEPTEPEPYDPDNPDQPTPTTPTEPTYSTSGTTTTATYGSGTTTT